jgi:DNA-binding ferritin-like protein
MKTRKLKSTRGREGEGLKNIIITSFNKNQIVFTFLEMLMTIKLYHWKTYSYAQHKSTDELYTQLNESIDKFVETLLGRQHTRLDFHKQKLTLQNISAPQILKTKIQNYKLFLENMPNLGTDLMNIRDEILGHLDQFLYLFSLK